MKLVTMRNGGFIDEENITVDTSTPGGALFTLNCVILVYKKKIAVCGLSVRGVSLIDIYQVNQCSLQFVL